MLWPLHESSLQARQQLWSLSISNTSGLQCVGFARFLLDAPSSPLFVQEVQVILQIVEETEDRSCKHDRQRSLLQSYL
jgi:hypothetical protein